jgi:hypothetical protein
VFLIPLAAGMVCAAFSLLVLGQFVARRRWHQLAWGGALAMLAAAALIEALAALWGWSAWSYRLYYLLGGILAVGWLGTGSLLVLSRRGLGPAMGLLMLAISLLAIPAVMVAPVDQGLLLAVEPGRGVIRPPASILAPITNILGSAALIGGAGWSAWSAWRRHAPGGMVLGLALIATGALAAAAGHGLAGQVARQELWVPLGELAGACLMLLGYLVVEAPRLALAPSIRQT